MERNRVCFPNQVEPLRLPAVAIARSAVSTGRSSDRSAMKQYDDEGKGVLCCRSMLPASSLLLRQY
eukprot:scaffold2429_cov263-Pinguiococcus_pyrenoidosus.AAC.8